MAADDPKGEWEALANTPWSDRARMHVTAWQERAYGALAEQSGMGWDPAGMFAKFVETVPNVGVADVQAATPEGYFTPAEWNEAALSVDQYVEMSSDPEPATPFTHAGLQMVYKFAVLKAEIELGSRDWRLPYRPRVTTLPTGDFNARTRRILATDEAAIMFDHTLLAYIHEFARIVAAGLPDQWFEYGKLPERSNAERVLDFEVAQESLAELLTRCVLTGTLNGYERPDMTWRNTSVSALFAAYSRQFLVAHELTHLLYRHMDVPSAGISVPERHQREYDADQVGSGWASAALDDVYGHDRVFGYWTADLTLAAFQYLYRAIWYIASGDPSGAPDTKTHPTPLNRRIHLLEANEGVLSEMGMEEDAARLKDLCDAASEQLEALLWPAGTRLASLRQQGAQAAVVWRPLIASMNGEQHG
jgi:hypothetical protein